MNSNIYFDAIEEANLLRKAAEENAKRKVLEQIAPQIKNMIDEQLNFFNSDINEPTENVESLSEAVIDLSENDDSDIEEVVLNNESFNALSVLKAKRDTVLNNISENIGIAKKINKVFDHFNYDDLTSNEKNKLFECYVNLIKDTISLRNDVILKESNANNKGLNNIFNDLIQEIKRMNRRNKFIDRLLSEAQTEDLMELDQILSSLNEQDEEEVDLDLEVEDEEGVAGELEVAEEAEGAAEEDLDDAAAAIDSIVGQLDNLKALLVGGEEVEVAEEVEEEEPAEEEEELELELEEGDDLGEHQGYDDTEDESLGMRTGPQHGHEQSDKDRRDDSYGKWGRRDENDELDEMYEIDEAMIRKELAKMLSEQSRPTTPTKTRKTRKAPARDRVVEIDEKELIAVLKEELGLNKRPTTKKVTTKRRRVTNEGRKTRTLSTKTAKTNKTNDSLRRQLAESKLLNVKVILANKLLQDKNLSQKQRLNIVEALDNAKTEREAKLVYSSLTKSLTKDTGTIAESRRRKLGSSSRAAQSSSPKTADGDTTVNRWAMLAGI